MFRNLWLLPGHLWTNVAPDNTTAESPAVYDDLIDPPIECNLTFQLFLLYNSKTIGRIVSYAIF